MGLLVVAHRLTLLSDLLHHPANGLFTLSHREAVPIRQCSGVRRPKRRSRSFLVTNHQYLDLFPFNNSKSIN
jgi:hypothetical protein